MQTSQADNGFQKRLLDVVEKAGNKVPHPVIIFLALMVLVVVLSHVLHLAGASVTQQVIDPATEKLQTSTVAARSLLTTEGLRFIYSSIIPSFMGFTAVGLIIVAMIGVGVAEEAGLIKALIRKLVAVSPGWAIAYILVFIGIISSIAADAGYLVLIPLAGIAFLSVGRHPLAGLAAGFASVAGAFTVNMLVKPLDAILTEFTNDAIHIVNPAVSIGLTATLWFSIVSVILLTVVITFVTQRVIEPRLGAYEGGPPDPDAKEDAAKDADGADADHESRGLLYRRHRARRGSGRFRPAHAPVRRAPAQSGHRRPHRQFAVHERPDRPDHGPLPGHGRRLRIRRQDDENQHRRDQGD